MESEYDSGAGISPETARRRREFEIMLENIDRPDGPKTGRWVLVIDDSRMARNFVAKSIQEFEPALEVVTAENGEQGLATLFGKRRELGYGPLFIVLDLEMPVMDGWETLKRLRKDYEERGEPQGTPVIILSSSSGEKGMLLKQSVHDDKSKYHPLVTVAKAECLKPGKYQAAGDKRLKVWLKHFLSTSARV